MEPAISSMVLLALGIIVILYLAVTYRNYAKKYAAFPSYPFFPVMLYNSVTGKIPKHLPRSNYIMKLLTSILQKHMKEGVCYMWFGQPYVCVYNEEAIKVLSNNAAALGKPDAYRVLRDATGNGLLVSDGDHWRKHRKLLLPLFHKRVLKEKLAAMNENAALLAEELGGLEDTSDFSILPHLCNSAMRILWQTTVNVDMDEPEDKENMKKFIELTTFIMELTTYRGFRPWLYFKFMMWFFPLGRQYLKVYNETHAMMREVCSTMKDKLLEEKSMSQTQNKNNSKDNEYSRTSLPLLMLDQISKDPTFTLEDFQSEFLTILAAGFHTVSYATLWSLFCLGHHPDIQEKVYKEIKTISNNFVTEDDLSKLMYLKCVIQEAMRIYTVIPMFARRISEDIQCGKYRMPKGTNIMFCIFMLHMNPEYYPEPEKFDPDRFRPGNLEKRPWTYIPFGEGTRYCIGKYFALMELQILLVHLLRKFKITSLDKKEDINFGYEIILAPSKPLRMKFTPRDE